jgi:outer membrane protein TolC
MRKILLLSFIVVAQGALASAQEPANLLKLTADDAVRMAIDQNVDLAAERLDTQISDTGVAAANAAFHPALTSGIERINQLQPAATFLIPFPTRDDAVTSSVGVSQKLRWLGTSYSASWTAGHTNSNSVLNTFNPVLQSGLTLNLSQPLLRDRRIDSPRLQVAVSRKNREIADTRFAETLVRTTADVKRAYWNLVSAKATVDARQSVFDLAEELARVNKAKVEVGESPPLDLVSAQAEVAAEEEGLIIAQTAVKQAEDRLRLLIFDPTDRAIWNRPIEPTDAPPVGTATLDVEAAVDAALRDRADLLRARTDLETTGINLDFAGNQRLPDVRVNASYAATGLGGTQLVRTAGFPGTIVGPGNATSFGSVLNQLLSSTYPTWSVGLSVNYPIGHSAEDAAYARLRLEQAQASARLKSAEGRAIQEVRSAAWNVEMDAKRIDTTRAARELADQRLDAERKRFDVGMSTSFLVIQAQRDLAQAKTNEVAAMLAYDLALVDFEAVQKAGTDSP